MSITTASRRSDRVGFAGIAEALRSEVLRGVLPPGDQLPPISDLSRRFGTTPITVRRALRQLEEEGLVRVEHGVGTFVAEWGVGDLLNIPGLSEQAAAVTTRVLARLAGKADSETAAALSVGQGARVSGLVRVREVAGRAAVYQVSWVPEALRALVADYRPEGSLYGTLSQRLGRTPVAADELIEPVRLPEWAAGPLGRRAGELGWRARRTAFGASGEPLVYDDAYLPADLVRIRVRRRGIQALMSFEWKPVEGAERGESDGGDR